MVVLQTVRESFSTSVEAASSSYKQDSQILFAFALIIFLLTIPVRFLPLVSKILEKIRVARRVANVLPFEMVLADPELLKKVESLAV